MYILLSNINSRYIGNADIDRFFPCIATNTVFLLST